MKSSAYSPLFHRHALTYMDQPLLFLKENLDINPPINKEEFTRCFCLQHWHKNVTFSSHKNKVHHELLTFHDSQKKKQNLHARE